jgi:hypothetical protein
MVDSHGFPSFTYFNFKQIMIYQILGYPILKEIYKRNLCYVSMIGMVERFGARSFQNPWWI